MSAPGLPFCVECKVNIEPNNAWGAVCSQQCNDVREAYQRGRDEERRDVVVYLRAVPWDFSRYGFVVVDIERGEHEVKR